MTGSETHYPSNYLSLVVVMSDINFISHSLSLSGETLVDGFGNTLPTELPLSPKQLDELGRNFHDSKYVSYIQNIF